MHLRTNCACPNYVLKQEVTVIAPKTVTPWTPTLLQCGKRFKIVVECVGDWEAFICVGFGWGVSISTLYLIHLLCRLHNLEHRLWDTLLPQRYFPSQEGESSSSSSSRQLPPQPTTTLTRGTVEILVFASPTGYMFTSSGFPLLNWWGILYKFL